MQEKREAGIERERENEGEGMKRKRKIANHSTHLDMCPTFHRQRLNYMAYWTTVPSPLLSPGNLEVRMGSQLRRENIRSTTRSTTVLTRTLIASTTSKASVKNQ